MYRHISYIICTVWLRSTKIVLLGSKVLNAFKQSYLQSERRDKFVVTLSFTPYGEHQTDFIARGKYLGVYI